MKSDRPCRLTSRRLPYSVSLGLLLALPLGARATSVWVASSSEKIRPSAGARSLSAAVLAAARNEFEAFQIAVTADGGAVSGVSASATALTGPHTLAAPRLFREELIHLGNASAPDGFTGDVPDAMVPDVDDVVGEKRNAFPFNVSGGQTRVIWAELHVPADALPGVYTGSVTLSAGGARLATVPLTVTVWDFALPSTSSLKSHFGLAYGSLPKQHGVSGQAFAQLRARYGQLALDHRISVSAFDDGYFTDLSHFEQYYGPLANGTAPTQLAGAKLTSIRFLGSRTASNYASWASFFKARGWFDRLFDYTCDEPPATCAWSDIPARNATMKQGDPSFRSLVTTDVQSATAQGVLSSIDIIVPVVNDIDGKSSTDPGGWNDQYSGYQRSRYGAFLASGPAKELWMYQSCMSHGCGGTSTYFTGWPSYMIDTASVRSRAMEWLSFAWGVAGELYWDTTYAYTEGSADPWSDQWQFSGNGDGTLFYPGTPARIGGATHIPVASLRLKMLREGMEDYEYLKLLSDAGDPALAQQIAWSLFPDAWTEPSVSDLLAARERIAARILELTGKPAPASDQGVASSSGSTSSGATSSGSNGGSTGSASGDGAGAAPNPSAPGSAPRTTLSAVAGSGCSAGSAAGGLAWLGLLAALTSRARRKLGARPPRSPSTAFTRRRAAPAVAEAIASGTARVQAGSGAAGSPEARKARHRQPPWSTARRSQVRHGSGIHASPRNAWNPGDSRQIQRSGRSRTDAKESGSIRAAWQGRATPSGATTMYRDAHPSMHATGASLRSSGATTTTSMRPASRSRAATASARSRCRAAALGRSAARFAFANPTNCTVASSRRSARRRSASAITSAICSMLRRWTTTFMVSGRSRSFAHRATSSLRA